MKKILVPIDFSEHSTYATEVAADMAKTYDAEIIFLHMLGLSEAIFTRDESQSFLEAQFYMKLAKKRFKEFLDKPFLKNIKTSQTVQNYKVFEEVNAVAKENNADLIVMGSHGSDGLSEIFVGSNTEKVVRTSEVPVLVIKRPSPDFKVERVVLGLDFQIETMPAYHKAERFFASMKAEVHLVHVNLPGINFMSTKEIQSKIDMFLGVAHHNGLPRNMQIAQISSYSVEEGMYNHAKNIDADLISVITHGRKGLAHFFKGSIGEALANHTELPVMTFKHNAAL
ncbi:universal stress protein [Pareuzebyella sediminis]|uniref:universal stress protein n=1 Tax=Pareuzebyella sediminis TaxID=2607998 RepID=UPI0011F02127|nr:universal stress protein [Pareuzebyella sediminis]